MADPIEAVKAEVVTLKTKVVAFVSAHVPHTIAAGSGYIVGKFGLVGWLLNKVF